MKKIIIVISLIITIPLILKAQTESPFRKKPYLLFQNKLDNTETIYTPEIRDIVIMWQLNSVETCTIEWGIEDDPVIYELGSESVDPIQESDIQYRFSFLINNLIPEEKYYYKVIAPIDNTEEFEVIESSFISPPLETSTDLTFYAYGDTRGNGVNGTPPYESLFHDEVCQQINVEINSDLTSQTFLLHAGDWNKLDSEDEWKLCYFNADDINAVEMLTKLPVMGTYGNHETYGEAGVIYEKYWPYSYTYYDHPIWDPVEAFYSFDYGPVHVCCLYIMDDFWEPSQGQINWLNADLTITDKKWKIIFFHAPGYSNSGEEDNNEHVQNIIQPMCEQYNVQLVIAGHYHYYAHWLVNGVHHLTLGGGGAPLYIPGSGGLKAESFHHFAKINIEDDFMDIIINHYDDGLSTWKNDFDTFTLPTSLQICDNTHVTWDENVTYADEIRICSGSTLTISEGVTVGFVENGKIILERGGKLELDGCTLTSVNDNELWAGIEVWGTSTAGQNPIDQGWVEIESGALNQSTIKNAICAIRAVKMEYVPPPEDNLPNYSFTGGIIQASDAQFINNQTAIQFYSYPHISVSYFNNCVFKLDDSYFGYEEPVNYMVVENMTGVDVTFCNFLNEKTSEPEYTGILSEKSTIFIEGDCVSGTPSDCDEWDNGEFINLEYGVYATAATTTRKVDIRHTDFINNYRGVYLSGMTSPRVTSNLFQFDLDVGSNGYGLYLDECTDYWVEDNEFQKDPSITQPPDPIGIGIIVNESGRDPNQIYLNEFNYVEEAIKVQGKNRNGKSPKEGLVIKCNDYNDTGADETIIWEHPIIHSDAGIAGNQGEGTLNIEDMAGNIFYYETSAADYDDIDNTANYIDYYFSTNASNNNVEPMDAQFDVTVDKHGKPTTLEWSLEEACESGINPGGGGGIEDERGKMSDAQSGIESTEAILTAMIDGGDTEALNTEVETSTPPETVQVYNELMSESPNLSETVVESTIEKETVLPNAMVRNVMVANPHTAKSLVLLEKLDERFDPMPEYMKAQILAGRSIQNLKQELEAQLAGYKLEKAIAMNNIIRYYNEQLEHQAASDSILALYQEDNTLNSNYRLAWLYLEQGEYQLGENIINNIPALFNLDEDEQQRYTEMLDIYIMLSDLYENGNTIASLTASQLTELQALASGGTIPARAYARNILMAIGELEYEEPILFSDPYKSSEAIEEYNNLVNTKPPQMLEVYPNPSKDYVILEYKLETEADFSIQIKDVTGKTIHTLTTTGKQDQITIVTENWKSGVYIATLLINGNSIESVKFTLVK